MKHIYGTRSIKQIKGELWCRKFRLSIIGQVCRGIFFSVYYPIVGVFLAAKILTKIIKKTLYITFVVLLWGLGIRGSIISALLMCSLITSISVTA